MINCIILFLKLIAKKWTRETGSSVWFYVFNYFPDQTAQNRSQIDTGP